MTIANVQRNRVYKIIKIDADIKIKRRLLDLGFIVGEQIKVVHISPLKKTFLVVLQGYILAIRYNLAQKIEVEIGE